MQEQKILDNKQISWYDEERAQLDYQMIFDDNNEGEDSQAEKQEEKKQKEDVKALLRERDQKWKKRLKKAREHAYAEGFEEGKKQGKLEIEEELSAIEETFIKAHEEWKQRQKLLEPGLLDLAFEVTESILDIPVENPDIRKKLEKELSHLLQKVNTQIKPFLWVSERDFEYVKELHDKYAPQTSVHIQVSEECNPGEFRFETDQKTVVYDFREMLSDFRNQLSLPSWT